MNIGIIGGGQLGMMLAEAAIQLNHHVFCIDPNPNASIKQVNATHICAPFNDEEAFEKLNSLCDVFLYEFENVDAQLLRKYKSKVIQKIDALELSKNRLKEKELAASLAIPTVQYYEVNHQRDLNNAMFPSILKTQTEGYDGKGQLRLHSKEDLKTIRVNKKMILESMLDFDEEISIIVSRDKQNHTVFYPPIKNIHAEGILVSSIPMWDYNPTRKKKLYQYSKAIVDKLDYVGTMAIEYFVKGNTVYFNEIAPRPHNSGHFSIEGTTISQFENMILATTNQAVIAPKKTKESSMINVLGSTLHYLDRAKTFPQAHIHDYGKEIAQPKRKMAHITLLCDSIEELLKIENAIKDC